MEFFAFFALVAVSALILMAGFLRPTGYMQLPCLMAAVFMGWVIPQLWSVRQLYADTHDGHLATLHAFCLVCLIATVWGWQVGRKSVRKAALNRAPLSDSTLLKICIAITVVSVLMSAAIGARALEERASATWSGPITIMYFFSNLKVISLFLSIYLTLKAPRPIVWALLAVNIFIYLPVLFVAFRRRGMLEAILCVILAFWFARHTVFPRLFIAIAMPIGMLFVFAVGDLRELSLGEEGERSWVAASDLTEVNFLDATPFTNVESSPELTNALNLVRFSNEREVHTLGTESWNRMVFQWVPAQIVGQRTKQAMTIESRAPKNIDKIYNEDKRIGATTTAMGEAYLEFWFFGAVFFFGTAFMMGRWWQKSLQGGRVAMMLYASGLPVAVLMPTAYAIYFANIMLLYGGAIYGFAKVLSARPRRKQQHPPVTNKMSSLSRGYHDT